MSALCLGMCGEYVAEEMDVLLSIKGGKRSVDGSHSRQELDATFVKIALTQRITGNALAMG